MRAVREVPRESPQCRLAVGRRRKVQTPGDPKLGIAYLRVSKDDQQLGPDAQRAAIAAWAAREGVTVTAWRLDDGVSGGSTLDKRQALLEALQLIRETRAGLLLVAKRDRLARDVLIASQIEAAVHAEGARVVSADGTANGQEPADGFMRTVIDGAAAYERALIRARTKAALAVKKARGERTGKCPYGWTVGADGKRLIVEPHEQACIAEVLRLHAEGVSQRKIARALWPRYKSRTNEPLGQLQVQNILRRAGMLKVTIGEALADKKRAPPAGPGGQPLPVAQNGSLQPEVENARAEVHPTTGQRLVNRRVVKKADYLRHGRPADLAWLRGQVATLRGMGISAEKIASALVKTGVRRGDGSDVRPEDVTRWATG